MSHGPIGVYRPGTTVLHRLRPGAKLLGLIIFAVLLISLRGALWAAIGLAVALTLALIARAGLRDLARVARGFAIIAVLLFAFQTWQNGPLHAFEVVGDLFALIIAANVVTLTTSTDDMITTITWALGPLRVFGVKPERVALAFSLTLRAIPSLFGIARETRDAARARGLERNPRAYATPLVIRSVAHARNLGDALHARGIDDDPTMAHREPRPVDER